MQSKTGKPLKDTAQRQERLSQQLRVNLLRRKAQTRQRNAPPDAEPDTAPPKSRTK